jgi:hypothetical protein
MALITDESMGWLRTAVGVSLLFLPAVPMRLAGDHAPTSTSVLLMRTIGIRDLVLGLGAVTASRRADGDGGPWTTMALASDSLDTVVSLASVRSIGRRDAWSAAALAFAFACGDVQARRAAAR